MLLADWGLLAVYARYDPFDCPRPVVAAQNGWTSCQQGEPPYGGVGDVSAGAACTIITAVARALLSNAIFFSPFSCPLLSLSLSLSPYTPLLPSSKSQRRCIYIYNKCTQSYTRGPQRTLTPYSKIFSCATSNYINIHSYIYIHTVYVLCTRYYIQVPGGLRNILFLKIVLSQEHTKLPRTFVLGLLIIHNMYNIIYCMNNIYTLHCDFDILSVYT